MWYGCQLGVMEMLYHEGSFGNTLPKAKNVYAHIGNMQYERLSKNSETALASQILQCFYILTMILYFLCAED